MILTHSNQDSRKYIAISMKSIKKEGTTIHRMNMQAWQLPVKMVFNSFFFFFYNHVYRPYTKYISLYKYREGYRDCNVSMYR